MEEKTKDERIAYEVIYKMVSGQPVIKNFLKSPEESDEDFKWGILDSLRLNEFFSIKTNDAEMFFLTNKVECIEFVGPFTKEEVDSRRKDRINKRQENEKFLNGLKSDNPLRNL